MFLPALRTAFTAALAPPFKLAVLNVLQVVFSRNSGAWYRTNKAVALPWYQDSAATTPVTALEQFVGNAQDQSGSNNNALQVTAASRPVLSSRVNLLTKSEDFTDAAWAQILAPITVAPNSTLAPDGNLTGTLITNTGINSPCLFQFTTAINVVAGQSVSPSIYVKQGSSNNSTLNCYVSGNAETNSTVTWLNGVPTVSLGTITPTANGFFRWSMVVVPSASGVFYFRFWPLDRVRAYTDSGSVYVWGAQLELGPVATRYQRVNIITDYDTAGFPSYLTFDGSSSYLGSATGGGGSAGFFFCAAIVVGGAGTTRTIYSDHEGSAARGYTLRVEANNSLTLYAGNGSGYTSASGAIVSVGTKYLVTGYDDGVTLTVQLSGAPSTITGRPVVVPGVSNFAIGRAAVVPIEYFNGQIYEAVYVRDSGLTAAQRLQIQRQVAAAAGITL